MHGSSAARLAFLKQILEETPGKYLQHAPGMFDELIGVPVTSEVKPFCFETGPVFYDYEIRHYGFMQPSCKEFDLPEDEAFHFYKLNVRGLLAAPAEGKVRGPFTSLSNRNRPNYNRLSRSSKNPG